MPINRAPTFVLTVSVLAPFAVGNGFAHQKQDKPAQAATKWQRHTSSQLTLELPASWKPLALSDEDWAVIRKGIDPRVAARLDDPKLREGSLWMAYDEASLGGHFLTSMNVRKRGFAKLDRATFESKGFRDALIASVRKSFAQAGLEDVKFDDHPLAAGVLSLTVESRSPDPDRGGTTLTVQHLLLRYPNLWFLSFTGDAASADALRAVSRRSALSFREPDIELTTVAFSLGKLGLPKGWVAIDLTGRDFAAERERIAGAHSQLVVDAIDRTKKSKAKLFAFAPETVKTSVIETVSLRRERVKSLSEKSVRQAAFRHRFEAELRQGLTDAGMLIQSTSRKPFGNRRPGLCFDYLLRTRAGLIQGQQYVVFEPPYAWFLKFTTSKARATPRRLQAFQKCAASFTAR